MVALNVSKLIPSMIKT